MTMIMGLSERVLPGTKRGCGSGEPKKGPSLNKKNRLTVDKNIYGNCPFNLNEEVRA